MVTTIVVVVALGSPKAFAEVDARVDARYSSIDAGPIDAHVMALGLGVQVQLRKQLSLSISMPVVVSVVESFSCCDVAAGNGATELRWRHLVGGTTLGAVAKATLPTAFGREKIVPALRVARRIEAARDADAYSLDVLALTTSGIVAFQRANLGIELTAGSRQRVAFGDEHATETHAVGSAEARTAHGSTSIELTWRGALQLAGEGSTLNHGGSVAVARPLGQFTLRAEAYLPLDRALLAQSAFSLGLNIGRTF